MTKVPTWSDPAAGLQFHPVLSTGHVTTGKGQEGSLMGMHF